MNEYAIRVTRLNYTYPDGIKALEVIDLDIRVGERVAIVGRSGSGKSTLLMHLGGIMPTAGTVKIMGQALDSSAQRQLRRRVGILFQNPADQLFTPTVYEDVALGLLNLGVPEAEIPDRVRKALEDVGLDWSIKSRFSLYLSPGEQRQVALAAVLAMKPAILVLDEPAGNLDAEKRRRIIKIIADFPATQVIATHDLELVLDICPRTIVMDRGKIRADGNTLSLLADAALMQAHGLEVPLSLRCGIKPRR